MARTLLALALALTGAMNCEALRAANKHETAEGAAWLPKANGNEGRAGSHTPRHVLATSAPSAASAPASSKNPLTEVVSAVDIKRAIKDKVETQKAHAEEQKAKVATGWENFKKGWPAVQKSLSKVPLMVLDGMRP
mmetsp:Transcript_72275/g.211803  ORF Transcript_72275/g.211803 Transcript_72275/m.211803 type:complete len:136 (+) Transcript_72275:100-507(+)